MSDKLIQKTVEIINSRSGITTQDGNGAYCSMAVINEKGFPHITTITVAKSDGIKKLYLCTGLSSNIVQRIKNNEHASICFNDNTYTFTFEGTVKVNTDSEIKKEMWYNGLANHFEQGARDINYCVLEFTTKNYSLFVDFQEANGTI